MGRCLCNKTETKTREKGEESMAIIEIDSSWEEAEKEFERKPIPEGTYPARVAALEQEVAASGAPMLRWQFEIESADPEINGRPVWRRTPLTGKGKFYLVSICKAVGVPWRGRQLDTLDYIGRRCRVVVGIDTLEGGRITNSVRDVLPL